MLTNHHARDAICCGYAQYGLYRFAIEISTVATNHQRCVPLERRDVEQRLHKVFEIVRLLKDR